VDGVILFAAVMRGHVRQAVGAAVAAVLVASCLATSGCGSTKPKQRPYAVLGHKTAAGPHAEATASVKDSYVDHAVRITATPAQRVAGSWTLSCTGGGASGGMIGRDADDFSGKTPLVVATRTAPVGQPTCTFVGVGRLSRSGRVKVVLLGR
jgi:hypothetical protein